ncbi:hypothetical protein P3T76_010307 [Phytophthora citrophthora]|uniref:Elicitin n=1 Tax=Phytophthora citrophthora TaxID=4793 RepID=A0AAD9GC55_9STRA|nr:hypothetical protein P3T76_010307 [Phytophthora citrophthora]
MISTRSSVLLLATSSALAFQGHVDATPCDADNYSKIATAVQTLRANCASWAAYLANGGVWNCDSKCHDAVVSLVDTLPDCTYGGPYGQNYKEVVENMVKSCGGQETSTSESTTAPSSTTAAPSVTTETPSATTAAPSSSNDSNNSTETATTDAPTATTESEIPTTGNDDDTKTNTSSTSASVDAGDAGTPASDVSTTSGASAQTVTSLTAMLFVVAVTLLQ